MKRKIKYSKRAVEILDGLGIKYRQVKGGLAFELSKSDYKILVELLGEDHGPS